MSNLPGKITQYLKGGPSTPTPERTTSTEAYFSADVPLEGDRSSEVQALSEGTNSGVSSTISFVKKKESIASSSREGSVLKAGHAKDDAPVSGPENMKEVGKGNARKRRASDILIEADLEDIMAMSALMREMNEKGVGEEEKADRLLEMQMRREEEREKQK